MANLPFLSCLLLALCTLSLSANDFISIDCGTSAPYEDANGVSWTGDGGYVKNGESRSVQYSYSATHGMDTLRVFTNHTVNCYIIDSVKRGRVLLRASFYYGNYDGKSSPPSFDLMFDGYYWAEVNNSGTTPSRYDVIYVPRKDSISVCVAKIKEGQFPYISTLEVRSLDPDMYSNLDDSYPVFSRRRVAFGSNTTIRFPDDPYDRQWPRDTFGTDGAIYVSSSSDAFLSSVLLTENKIPSAVLKNAVTSAAPNSSIDLFMGFPSFNVSAYINMYFSEVTRLKPNQTRSFYIFKDNERFSPAISPPYGNCTRVFIGNITVSSNTTFSLVPAEYSTLPPLINAMEVLRVGEYRLKDGTHEKDIRGLASLQEAFSPLQVWGGDPCLPSFYNWEWVKCNDDPVPRVTSLLLGGFGLSGLLPDVSSMDALHTINLSNNSLRGNIPDFLGTLPNLLILNVVDNQFNGTVPTSLSMKKNLLLRVTGNPELYCRSNKLCDEVVTPPNSSSSIRKGKNILEVLFVAVILLPFVIVLQ